ncbi:unnamed protein product [Nyctereutes procyonoides]|uniref:(raccoon dog) hypothetical protein n=1 Tax=Nyctereutes procyonoides TaxID=34880 RepID=A0A811Y684_NYCPR|nr:unnamed protein product [Nyctereutes procyonoides]
MLLLCTIYLHCSFPYFYKYGSHDLRVLGLSPMLRCHAQWGACYFSLCLSPHLCMYSLSQII